MADVPESSDLWQYWILMAEESQLAAIQAHEAGYTRSASSRYYYSAYQAITALLHYTGQRPPEKTADSEDETGREGWSHQKTPDIIIENCGRLIRSKDERQRLASNLKELYKIRLEADYHGKEKIKISSLVSVARKSKYLMKVVLGILPEREK